MTTDGHPPPYDRAIVDNVVAMARAPKPTPPPATDTSRLVRFTRASTIPIRPVHWLWNGRFPLGSLSLIGGREGIGKTTVAYALAADITQGTLDGAYHGTPKSVIVAATEDSWEHTIVPRLIAAGANLERIYRVDVVETDHARYGTLTLPLDLHALGEGIREHDVAMLLLDPLMSRLSGKLDTHKDSEVRQALEPLSALADRHGAAVIGLIHVNKSGKGDALDRIMGSRAFAAVARSVFFVMKDPDNPEQRLANTEKNNLGRSDLPTLVFHLVNTHVGDTDEGPVFTGRVEWLGETDRTINDALEDTVDTDTKSAIGEAKNWLEDYLTINGRTESKRAKEEGRKNGHSEATLKRAAQKAGVHVEAVGFPRVTYWTMPTPDQPRPAGHGRHEPTCPRCQEKESACDCRRPLPNPRALTAGNPEKSLTVVGERGNNPLRTLSTHSDLTEPIDLTDLTEPTGPTGHNGQNGHSGLSRLTDQLSPEMFQLNDPTDPTCPTCGDPDSYCGCDHDLAILNPN